MIPMIITQASWRRGTPRSGMQVSAGALLSVGLGDRFIGSTPHIFSVRFTISTAIRSWRSASWGIPTVDAEVDQVLVDQGARAPSPRHREIDGVVLVSLLDLHFHDKQKVTNNFLNHDARTTHLGDQRNSSGATNNLKGFLHLRDHQA